MKSKVSVLIGACGNIFFLFDRYHLIIIGGKKKSSEVPRLPGEFQCCCFIVLGVYEGALLSATEAALVFYE